MGETSLLADVGLLIVGLVGLLVPGLRVLSCFAVMPTYLDAREPGVMIGSTAAVLGSGTVLLGVVAGFERVLADPPPGVRLPIEADGVILPDCDAGVIRPLEIEDTLLPFVLIEDENEGVALPDNEGVTRPLRLEATDEGLEIDTAQDVEGESLEVAMNTPQFGGQVKYRFLRHKVSQSNVCRTQYVDVSRTRLTHQLSHRSFLYQRNLPQVPRQQMSQLSPRSRQENEGCLQIRATLCELCRRAHEPAQHD